MSALPPSSSPASSPPESACESGSFPIWLPPAHYAADRDLAQIGKANLLTGKSHRNRLRESQAHLSSEVLEWARHIVRRNIMASDVFTAFANGEILCAILNTVCPADPPITITFGAVIKSAEARSHVGAFLRAAARLGVAQHHLFKPKDLMKGANNRRVMRTLLYFVLSLIRFGCMPIPALVPRVLQLCSSTGYARPEVLVAGRNQLGKLGGGFVRPTTSGARRAVNRALNSAGDAAPATQVRSQQETESARRNRLEQERIAREQAAASFRPQLHFMGAKRAAKPKPEPISPGIDLTLNPHATNLSPQRSPGTPIFARGSSAISPSAAFSSPPPATRNNYDSPPPSADVGISTRGDFHSQHSPHSLDTGASTDEGTYTNAGILSRDAQGQPMASFPHAAGERFESALQNMDLSDLLQSATDETDIDKPMMAALLFPEFGPGGEAAGGADGKHGAWNRSGADLHVRVEPIKYAMWTSRHPFKACASVLAAWILALILLFAPYPTPFTIDLSTTSFHANGDKYYHNNEMFKAAVQSSWEYHNEDDSQLILEVVRPDRTATQQAASTPPQRRSKLQSMSPSSPSSSFPSSSSIAQSLVFDLLEHHASTVELNRAAARASGTLDASSRTGGHAPASSSAPSTNAPASTMESMLDQLLQAAAGEFNLDARWQERARSKALATARARNEELANADSEADSDLSTMASSSPSPAGRRQLSYSSEHATSSQVATTISMIYMGSWFVNMLTPGPLAAIRGFEQKLTTASTYMKYCLRNPTATTGLSGSIASDALGASTGRYLSCEYPDTVVNYFSSRVDESAGIVYMDGANATNIQNVSTIVRLLQSWDRIGFFDRYFDVTLPSDQVFTRHVLSTLSFGVPLPSYVGTKDTSDWSADRQISWLQNQVLDTYISMVEGKTLGVLDSIAVALDGPGVQMRILRDIIFNHDVRLIIGALFAVIIYAVLHIRSLFIVVGSMVQIIVAFFITAFWFRVVFRFDTLNILHVICIFVILALGTNDMFVLFDTFTHSSLLRLRVELPFDRAVRKKAQEERAYNARQADRSCNGWFMRFWFDISGCYTAWRCIKAYIPGFTVTDYDIDGHFQTGAVGAAPNSATASMTHPPGGFMEGATPAGAGNPIGGRASFIGDVRLGTNLGVGVRPARRGRHGRTGSGNSKSTPTRLEKDSSDDEGDEEAERIAREREQRDDPFMASNPSAPGMPGLRAHRRLGSQEANPPRDDAKEEDIEAESHSFPIASEQPQAGRGPKSERRFSKTAEDLIRLNSATSHQPLSGGSNGGLFPPRQGFVDNGRGASTESERKAAAQVLADLQRMDDRELEEDGEESANLEAMASRHGGLKSAIIRKRADRVALRLSWTYRRAGPSMIVTNGTIIVALFAIGVSDIGPIKAFGVFMGSVALVNFCLSLTFLPTVIVLQYMHLQKVSIIPRSCWARIRECTASVDTAVNAGDVKYDDALLDSDNEEEAAACAEAGESGPRLPPINNSSEHTHVHASSGAASPSVVARELAAQRVTVRAAGSSGNLHASMDDLPGEGEDEEAPHIRGGVTVTKEADDEPRRQAGVLGSDQRRPSPPPQSRGLAQDPNSVAPPRKQIDGQLVKQGLTGKLDAERSKANVNLEKSRRNQMLLFLNATIFRFRFLFLCLWAIILAVCLWQAVKLTVPQTLLTILPPSSNLEQLKAAYAQLPSCTGCTYEFDRVEHQVIPFINGLPVTTNTALSDTAAPGGDATVSAQAKREQQSVMAVQARADATEKKTKRLLKKKKARRAAAPQMISLATVDAATIPKVSIAIVEHPFDLVHAQTQNLVWRTRTQLVSSPLRGPRQMFRARQHASTLFDETSSDVSDQGPDYLTISLGGPSPPPLLLAHDVLFSSVRVTFAQSLFGGLQPITSYTLVIVPTASVAVPASVFTTAGVTCAPEGNFQVARMVLRLRPKLAQLSLSPLAACVATNVTICASSSSGDLPPVTLGADWFSSATIQGGANTPGVTYIASGGLIQDLSGFVHNTSYSMSIYATSAMGDSLPSTSVTFKTLDGTPPSPVLTALKPITVVTSSGSDPQFFIDATLKFNFPAGSATPPPTSITIHWAAVLTTGLPALPADGQTQFSVLSLTNTTWAALCATDSGCTLTVPTILTTQVRGGYALRVWATSTNQYAESTASASLQVTAPTAVPFAPALVGYAVGSSVTGYSFAAPPVRVFFQVPSLNGGASVTVPTHVRLLYAVNAASISEADMAASDLVAWSAVTPANATLYPTATLQLALPIDQAPLYQADFSASVQINLQPNHVYQIRLKAVLSGTSSAASNVLAVATTKAPLVAPTITSIEYKSASSQLVVSFSPPAAYPADPSPTYTFQVLLTAPQISTTGNSLTIFEQTVSNTTTVTINSVASLSSYCVSVRALTAYTSSVEIAPPICFSTGTDPAGVGVLINGVSMLTITPCQAVASNRLCFSSDLLTTKVCDVKSQTRVTPVDQLFIMEAADKTINSTFTATRRYPISNDAGTRPLLINSVVTVPLQPLQTFNSPNGTSRCLNATTTGYDLYQQVPSDCFVPCLSSQCASACSLLTLSVQTTAGVLVGSIANVASDSVTVSSLNASLTSTSTTNLVVVVSPRSNLNAGLYSCGFNFNAQTSSSTGGVMSSLGYDMASAQTPFDIIIALRVLPLDRPMPVRTLSYGDVSAVGSNGLTQPAKNITFTVPYSPASAPICSFQLYYTETTAGTSQSYEAFLAAPTVKEGFAISALLFGLNEASGVTHTFSVRAYNALGALDFESTTATADCSSLSACNSQGSCSTPLHINQVVTRGDQTDLPENTQTFPLLSNLFNQDVAQSASAYVLGSTSCDCNDNVFGPTCDNPCPTATPAACSGRGTCNSVAHTCACDSGFGGDGCSQACPDSCSGRGTCVANPSSTTGGVICDCADGWGGPNCGVQCPVGPTGAFCGGFGVCDITGNCRCDYQHRGPTCEFLCPGSYQTSNGTMQVCNGHGKCIPPVSDVTPIAPTCVCDSASNDAADCAIFWDMFDTATGVASIHFSLPPAPALPSYLFPVINVAWGISDYKASTNFGGISSASDTGADGTQSVSISSSQSAGTPEFLASFDFTLPAVQSYLARVCDVVFTSGLINEGASTCLMTLFQTWYTANNVAATFPIAATLVVRSWVSFLNSLTGDQRLFQQHVGFIFSTQQFVEPALESLATHNTTDIHNFRTQQQQQQDQTADNSWFKPFLAEAQAAAPNTAIPGASVTSAGVDQSVFLTYHQLAYLLEHPRHGQDFRIVFDGEDANVRSQARYQQKNTPSIYIKICYFSMQFFGTFDATTTTAAAKKKYADAWDTLIPFLNHVAPAGAGPAFHASDAWASMSQQLSFASGLGKGFAVMFVFIFVFVTIFTGWNLKLAFLIIFTIGGLVCLLFGILVSTRGEDGLGVIEYICAQIVIALSVHYLLYIGHAYIVSPFSTRFGRARHGLLEWGASVMSAGASMLLSSFVLLFATIQVLSTVGEILAIMSIVMVLFLLTFFIPLLQSIGPMAFDPHAPERKKAKDEKAKKAKLDALATRPGPDFALPTALFDADRPADRPLRARPVQGDAFEDRERARERERIEREERERVRERERQIQGDVEGFGASGLRGGGGFGGARDEGEEEFGTGLLSSIEMQRPGVGIGAGSGLGPVRHERKPGGRAPNPIAHHGLRKTASGNLMLSSSEDEDDSSPSMAALQSRGLGSKTEKPARRASLGSARSSGSGLAGGGGFGAPIPPPVLAPVKPPRVVLPEVHTRGARGSPSTSADSLTALASPSDAVPTQPTPPNPNASPSSSLGSATEFSTATPQGAKRRRKPASKPSSSMSFQGDSPLVVPDEPPRLPASPRRLPPQAARSSSWDDDEEVVIVEQRSAKKQPRAKVPPAAEDVFEIEHEEEAPRMRPSPSSSPPPARRPVTLHPAPSPSASPSPPAPARKLKPTLPPAAAPALDESNDWDREPAEPVPSRMASSKKPEPLPLRAPLPPVSFNKPVLGSASSLGGAPSALSPLKRPGSLAPASPLRSLAATTKQPLRAALPARGRPVPLESEDDSLELDISHDESPTPLSQPARNPLPSRMPAAAARKPPLDRSIEIENSWDD